MSRFIDFDQPIFFTPPSGKESGPRRLFKGGGGGSSGTPYYAQQDRLFGTQADISQQLYNQYAEMAPTYLANTQGMVDDAMDGTLGRQMREQAGNNATATMGAALDANNRNMQRYGMGFSANRLLTENNRNAIMGAAQKAGAMNQASIAAEDQKWNRNAGAYGQIAGMGTGAMSGMGSAGAGYGNMGNAAQAGSMANAQGFGKFGSAIAGIGMGYANGGEVKRNKFASGAYVRKPFVNHLKPIDWRNMPTSGPGYTGTSTGDALGMMAMGMVPGLGMLAAKDLLRGDKSTLRGLYKDAKQWGTDQYDAYQQQKTVDAMNGSSGAEGYTFYSEPTADVASGADYTTATDGGAYSDASSLWDYTYANGGPVKRGLRLASGGYAAPIDGSNFESDPNRFRAEPPSAEELYMMRLGNSAMAQGTNPMTYIKLANDYGKLSNASAAQDRLATAQANYDQTLNASQAAGTAGDSAQAVGTAVDTADAASSTADAADTINAATDLAEASNAADAASKAADGVGGGNPVGSVIKLGADLASGRDAGEAVADAALGYGGAELGAAIGTAAIPVVGTVAGGLLGGLLGGSIFKDGGAVGRRDYTPGGKVKGPGTETSDDIPAWLSDGEIVHNAEAVKLAGKDALLEINDAGLEVRDGKATPKEAQAKIGQVMIERGKELTAGSGFVKRGVKLAGGGFLGGNLGVALGAGVDQYDKQLERAERKAIADRSYELQKQNNDRLNQVADRQSKMFDQQQKDYQEKQQLKSDMQGIANKYQTIGPDVDKYIAGQNAEAEKAAAEAGTTAAKLTPEQEAVIRDSVKLGKNQEYINAFNRFAMLDQAGALEKQAKLEEAGNAVAKTATDPVIQSIAKIDPINAAKLHVGETNVKERIEGMQRQLESKINSGLAGLGRTGTDSGSGSGGKSSAKDPNEWGLKDAADAIEMYVPKDGSTGINRVVDGKPVEVPRTELVSGMHQAMNAMKGSVPVDVATQLSYNVARQRLSGAPMRDEKGNRTPYAIEPVFNNGQISFVMNDDKGRVYNFGGNRVISDSELANFDGGDKVIRARQQDMAQKKWDKFLDAEKSPEAKQDFIKKWFNGDDQAYEKSRAEALYKINQFDKNFGGVDRAVGNQKPNENKPTAPAANGNSAPAKSFAELRAEKLKAYESAKADKDLIAMEAQHKRLLRGGWAVDANNMLAQINELKKSRYGI